MDTVTSATSMTEAKRIEKAVRTAFKIYRFDHLDPSSLEVVVRVFKNKGWKLPVEIEEPEPTEQLTLVRGIEEYLRADPKNRTERKLYAIDRLVEYFGEGYPLDTITVAKIKGYRRERLAQGVSNGTVNIEVSALSGIFTEQLERGTMEINPCSMVSRLPETQRDTYISWDDYQRIRNVSDWLNPILTVLYYTGMRPSEVFDLDWKEVSFSRQMIVLSPKRTKEGKNPNQKTLREKRVPMRPEVRDLLWSMKHEAGENVVPMSGPVFMHKGRQITRNTKRKCWARIVRLTGLDGVQMRDLRHTFKTNMALSGIDRTIRNAIVGHATKLPVEDLYIHVPDHKLLEAVEGMTFDHGASEVSSYGGEESDARMTPNSVEKKKGPAATGPN